MFQDAFKPTKKTGYQREVQRVEVEKACSESDQISPLLEDFGERKGPAADDSGAFIVQSWYEDINNEWVPFGEAPLDPPRKQAPGHRHRANAIPEEYCCPLLLGLMSDPVMAQDGNTYERSEVEKYFATCSDGAFGSTTLFKSPLSGVLISTSIVTNRNLEKLIVDDVNAGAISLSKLELEEWRNRRALKIALERSDPREPYIVPEQYPADFLARLVRLDRPDEGNLSEYDSGLSLALPSPVHVPSPLGRACCAVTFCFESLPEQDGSFQSCRRCQRQVCQACTRVEVSDILCGDRNAPMYKICIECVFQVSDVLASMETSELSRANMSFAASQAVRERLIRRYVAKRLEHITQTAFAIQKDFELQNIYTEMCDALRRDIACKTEEMDEVDRLVVERRDQFKKQLDFAQLQDYSVPNPGGHLQGLQDSLAEIFAADGNDDHGALVMPRAYTRSDLLDVTLALDEGASSRHRLPLNLVYPTSGSQHQLQVLQGRLEAFSAEKRPLLRLEVSREKMQLQNLCDKMERSLTLKKTQRNAVEELLKRLELLGLASNQAEANSTNSPCSAASIGDALCSTTPVLASPEDQTAPMLSLLMCSNCHAGPVEHPPLTGCANCNHQGSSWVGWDGVAGPHR